MKLAKKEISGNDLGFGNSATQNNQRMVNPNGTSNIRRTGLPFFRSADVYNSLITMHWGKFSLLILLSYFIINSLFAFLYMWAGMNNLNGSFGVTTSEKFLDAFFFSAQTISTVGYGHISPKGVITSSIAAFESMMGLLSFALATGLLYGRFSRPTAKLTYSKNILVSPYQDKKGLMFRFANYRSNQLIEIEVEVFLSMNINANGKQSRTFFPLILERSKISILSLSWTVVHPIDQESPIFGLTADDLQLADVEFIVMVKAFDDTFSQTVHGRTSYQNEEIVWNAKFEPVFQPDETGLMTIDMSKLSDYKTL